MARRMRPPSAPGRTVTVAAVSMTARRNTAAPSSKWVRSRSASSNPIQRSNIGTAPRPDLSRFGVEGRLVDADSHLGQRGERSGVEAQTAGDGVTGERLDLDGVIPGQALQRDVAE